MTLIFPVLNLFIFIEKPKHWNRTMAEGNRRNDHLPPSDEIRLIDKEKFPRRLVWPTDVRQHRRNTHAGYPQEVRTSQETATTVSVWISLLQRNG